MATNDFLPFANGGGANVLTQAQYAALTSLLSGGYQSGVANSAQMNKTWRQSSIMAAVLGQFAADYSGNNSVDDGTTATLETNLVAAIRSASKTGVILADTGAANAYTAVNVPPLTSGTWVDGVVQQVRIAHANTGASTYAPDGLTAIPVYGLGLQPLQGSELALNGIAILVRMTITGVNGGNPIAVLLECAGGAQQVAPATQSQHALQAGQALGLFLGVQVITSSGTYTPGVYTLGGRSVTATKAIVEAVGGGGGGGGVPATNSSQLAIGNAGAAGAYGKILISSGLSSQTVTIGAAGAGGAAGTNAGGSGGQTSFGALLICPGGGGGASMNATTAPIFAGTPGGGGVPSGSGTFICKITGQGGQVGIGLAVNAACAGSGGNSPLGTGGTPAIGTAGANASGYGSGGGGACAQLSQAALAGGNGSAGVTIIYEYA